MNSLIESNLRAHQDYFSRALADDALLEQWNGAAEAIVHCLGKGGKIMVCGNGGSMSDAMHFAEELVGNFRAKRRPFPAVALSDSGALSCIANDFGYDQVFARQVEALGKPGDVLIAISTSGNSANILNASQVASKVGMKVVGLTAGDGGHLNSCADFLVKGPDNQYSDRIQELHIVLLHTWVEFIEKNLL
jgi:D-sedoheptulose 7-phosphate isomerase